MKYIKQTIFFISIVLIISGCKNGKLPGSDARKIPYDPKERVKRNLEQGKGFRLNSAIGLENKRGGNFQFASSNELWRASLDVLDFMPLASANYSGGMIITDWYTDSNNLNESIKIIVRFLTNEIRSDALSIKVFYKKCDNSNRCTVDEKSGPLSKELTKQILKLATQYKQKSDSENFEPYIASDPKD